LLLAELAQLKPVEDEKFDMEQAAQLLGEFCSAWARATAEQKQKIARLIFEEIWVENKQVVAIKPRPVFEQFFALDFSERRKRRGTNQPMLNEVTTLGPNA